MGGQNWVVAGGQFSVDISTDTKKFHEEMSKDLKKSLRERRENLIKNVSVLREGFRKKEREVRADLAEASKIWNKMNETLRSKKTKPPIKIEQVEER